MAKESNPDHFVNPHDSNPSPSQLVEIDRQASIGDAMRDAIEQRGDCQHCGSRRLEGKQETMPNGQVQITISCQECKEITDQFLFEE